MHCLNILLEFLTEKLLNDFIQNSVIDISNLIGIERDNTELAFHSYIHYKIVIYKSNLTFGNVVALPEHFIIGQMERI